MYQKNKFTPGEYYHIFNKSIAGFKIFDNKDSIDRFLITVGYYNSPTATITPLSSFLKKIKYYNVDVFSFRENCLIKIIAYCIMPDHYHLLIKIIKEGVFSSYIGNVENSYVRYLNKKIGRKGPLWQSGFRSVKIEKNEQLLHVSRYIHLNPTTAQLVNKPQDWPYSSYKNYLFPEFIKNFSEISINSAKKYQNFVEDQIDYQKKLKLIKRKLLD